MHGRSRVLLRLLIFAVAAPCVLAPSARGDAGLVFEGAVDTPRAVPLLPQAGRWQSRVSVVVRSDAPSAGLLVVRYFPARGEPVRVVGRIKDSSPVVEALRPQRHRVPVRPGQLVAVELQFTVPAGAELSEIDGTLVASLEAPHGGATPATPATLELRGAMAAIKLVPSEVRLHVLRHCMATGLCGATAHVIVRGEPVGTLAAPDKPLGEALLRNDDGAAVRVTVLPDLDGDGKVVREGGGVRATVRARDIEGVGKLAGTVALEPALDGGPALPVTVTVGQSLPVAVVTVLLGAVLGGWLVQRAGVRRKRRLLEIELRSALSRFESELRSSKGAPVSYDLSPFLDPRPRSRAPDAPYPGRNGAIALIWDIRTAQDAADFQDVVDRKDEMVARIERWVGVERVARTTAALLEKELPKRGARSFNRSLAYQNTDRLFERAREHEPVDDDAAELVRGSLAREAVLLSGWRVLWEVHRTLEEAVARDPKLKSALAEPQMKKLLQEAGEKSIEARLSSPEPQARASDLRVDLRQAADAALEIIDELGVRRPRLIADREDADRALIRQLGLAASSPGLLRESGGARRRLKWQYVAQVARDQVWTLARALVAATAYTLTIYDDTWGTPLDFATAFTAGFLSETIVNWALLPAFQSYRTRRAAPSAKQRELEKTVTQLQRALVEQTVGVRNGNPPEAPSETPALP